MDRLFLILYQPSFFPAWSKTYVFTHCKCVCSEREEIWSRGEKLAFAILRLCWSLFICSWNNIQHEITFCVKQHSANLPHSSVDLHQLMSWPITMLTPDLPLVVAKSHPCADWGILRLTSGDPSPLQGSELTLDPISFPDVCAGAVHLLLFFSNKNLSVTSFLEYMKTSELERPLNWCRQLGSNPLNNKAEGFPFFVFLFLLFYFSYFLSIRRTVC